MSDLKLVNAEPEGGSAYALEVTEAYLNLRGQHFRKSCSGYSKLKAGHLAGVMHGGAAALIFGACLEACNSLGDALSTP